MRKGRKVVERVEPNKSLLCRGGQLSHDSSPNFWDPKETLIFKRLGPLQSQCRLQLATQAERRPKSWSASDGAEQTRKVACPSPRKS